MKIELPGLVETYKEEKADGPSTSRKPMIKSRKFHRVLAENSDLKEKSKKRSMIRSISLGDW